MQTTSSNVSIQRDTRAWQLQVWVSFGLAVFLCAKTLHDRHEADVADARIRGRREARSEIAAAE